VWKTSVCPNFSDDIIIDFGRSVEWENFVKDTMILAEESAMFNGVNLFANDEKGRSKTYHSTSSVSRVLHLNLLFVPTYGLLSGLRLSTGRFLA